MCELLIAKDGLGKSLRRILSDEENLSEDGRINLAWELTDLVFCFYGSARAKRDETVAAFYRYQRPLQLVCDAGSPRLPMLLHTPDGAHQFLVVDRSIPEERIARVRNMLSAPEGTGMLRGIVLL